MGTVAPPPAAAAGGWRPPASPVDTPRAADLGALTTALTWLLATVALASAVLTVFRFVEWSLLDDLSNDPFSVSFSDLEASDDRINALSVMRALVVLATGVVFIIWLHRATSNLRAFGHRDLRWTPGWAIGAWFIPFANLVIPKLVVDDAWRGAAPTPAPTGPPSGAVPGVFHLWWITLVGSVIVDRIGDALAGVDDATLTQLQTASLAMLTAALLASAAAVLGIVVVHRTAARHRSRAAAQVGPDPLRAYTS